MKYAPHKCCKRALAAAALMVALAAAAVLAQETAPPPQNNPPKLERNPAAALATPTPVPNGNVAIRFVGVTHFTDKQLRSAIADQIIELQQQGVGPATADDAAFFLGIFYRKNGYANVNVDWKVLDPGSVELDVTEGTLVLLDGVDFLGVRGLPAATLKDYITSTTRERFPNPKAALPFAQSDVDTGVERIRGLYASEGFLNAVVDPAKITFSRDGTRASVLVTVREGMQYHFGTITFSGDLVFYPNTELLNQLKPFTSKPYTPEQVVNMQRAVVYYYKTNGYYDPKVDVQSDPNLAVNGCVPVAFNIQSGAVYRFGGVSQEGLNHLSPRFLPDRFASLKGKFYNPQLLDQKFREMMQTGLFRQLRIEPRPQPDNTIELHMVVDEEKVRELGFSAGYGTFEGLIVGAIAGDRDLFGTGRPLTANVELSQNFLRGEILYSDPWLLESDYQLDARLFGQSEQWYRYSVFETGFKPQISKQITQQLDAAVFLQAKEVSTTDQGIDPSEIGPTSYFVSTAGASLTLDTRAPDKLNPRSGMIGTLIGEVASSALGSTVEFARVTGRLSYYIPVTANTLLALGARGGWMEPLEGNSDDIPIDERFFNGGSRSVRSFPERRLGPEDWHGYPIGGDTFTTFNIEYNFPVYGSLIGAVFADAGSVGATPNSVGTMRYGVGPGLRYASPVGPLRVDVGINPDRRTGERHVMFQISFGMAF
ncbi:MAG: BamA/TamA family outer membrane protein [Chthoniobacteraceae bacterium]|jgi:outer membrane protein assembly complex protein YaeT